MRSGTYLEALYQAAFDAALADGRVVFLGADLGGPGAAALPIRAELAERFSSRILPTPISEMALAGAGVGVALAGLRPLVDLSTSAFMFQGLAQIVNEAANVHYMTGGASRAPVVFYGRNGIRGAGAAQHSHCLQEFLASVPGLQLLLPASVADAYAMLRWALLDSPNPTVVLSHPQLFSLVGAYDLEEELPIGRSRVVRPGDAATVVASSVMVLRSLAAAEEVRQLTGKEVAVVDLRSLRPLDLEPAIELARASGRVLVVDEGHRRFGVAAEVAQAITEAAFDRLRAPVARLTSADTPIPFSPPLEQAVTVDAAKITQALTELLARG